MIDFRYHLVSIIAVFLALAVGLVVGSTALSGQTENLLRKAETELSRTNATLSKDKKALIQQVNVDQAFAQANSRRMIGGLLTGQSAVLIVAPGADSTVIDGVTASLSKAGAHVTGQVSLSQAFLDTSGPTESTLSQLAQRLQATATITLSPPDSSAVAGQRQAAAVLAAAIVSKGGGLLPSSSQFILNSFGQQGFLSVSNPSGGTTLAPATLAVLVVPAGPPSPGNAGINASQALVAVAQKLGAVSSGTVMAGGVSSIATDSPISDAKNAGQVSTVDNADTESGQIMVVQALSLQLAGKPLAQYGQYGVESGAVPSPAPIPSGTAGVSSSPAPNASASAGSHR